MPEPFNLEAFKDRQREKLRNPPPVAGLPPVDGQAPVAGLARLRDIGRRARRRPGLNLGTIRGG